ncbi:MAG: type II toxin-antitoxin system VapC family toxin [Candidatus Riflebacteria bacterium]|nr:type II toxin-antitoxin system VapC family toxin [Candidatus Riflebacteria bacterium]
MIYILDTNICIYFFKANPHVMAQIEEIGLPSLAVTNSVLAELYFGAFHSKRVEKNIETIDKFKKLVKIIPDSDSSAKIFGEEKAKLLKTGKPLDDFDIHIASIALAHKSILVTNNQAHFKRISGLKLANWLQE